MELRFDAMLCFNLGNENSDAGHIKFSCGPQVFHPWFLLTYLGDEWWEFTKYTWALKMQVCLGSWWHTNFKNIRNQMHSGLYSRI